MTESITMTTADVARLLHHPEPESHAAALKVGRLVRRGLPKLPHCVPAVFIRKQVIDWLAAEALKGSEDAQAEAEEERPKRRRRRKKRTTEPAKLTPIQARLAELKKGAA